MNASFRHSSAGRADGAAGLFDAAAQHGPAAGRTDQACCCVARAVVRVVMPPTASRPHETELLLCGHHYRASRAALSAAHASVRELAGNFADPSDWFHGDRGQRAQAPVAAG
ncbi:MAG TPA: hypothetical protein VMK84_01070 [Streptosporangiaceae bacterium]|nr:hypothetical protein [Streptosporangiaceae bacterium]